jgi:hypothetical protein
MFESRDRLRRDVSELVDALRALGDGRYAAVFDARSVAAESPAEPAAAERGLRLVLEERGAELLRVPAALHGGEEISDLFADWTADEFLLAVVNGRVGVLVACPDAQRLEADSGRLLRTLFDRLLRLDAAWRVDARGRGLFFGSPRIDTVVIPRPATDASR